MTKLNIEKVNGVKPNLNNIINGINAISVLKERIMSAMIKEIEADKVESILSREEDISILSEKETISFFKVIYKQIKDETFNPKNFILPAKRKVTLKAIDNPNVFNSEFKDQFLSEHRVDGQPYAEETKRVAVVLFGKIGRVEALYNKDVYDFNNKEFEELLRSLKATTKRSLQNSISTIDRYISFAINKGVTSRSCNIANEYSTEASLVDFLDEKADNIILTMRDVYNLSEYSENAQDGVILNLLFDGVSYRRKFVELTNLRIQDVDMDNLIINVPQLVDEETGEILPERQVPISEETARLIRYAMKEDKYVSLKGNTSRKYKIAESDYVLRGLRNNHKIKWENVNQRILRIAKVEGYPSLNATNISYSGQVHYAMEMMKQGYHIDEAVLEMINRFNLTNNESAHFYLKARIEKASELLN